MSAGRLARAAAVTGLLAAAGCRGTAAPAVAMAPAPPPAQEAWESTLASVRASVDAGLYARADSALEAFAARYPATAQSAEAHYWRALVQLDPPNPEATPRAAIAAIDAYLAGGAGQPRYLEALVLRRTASLLTSVRLPEMVAPADSAPPAGVDPERLRAASDTIRQLRAELERTQAELDRIRRRVRPTPPPTPRR